MSIKISLKNNLNAKSAKNHVFFTKPNFDITGLKNLQVAKFSAFINNAISSNRLDDKKFLSFNITATQKIILIKINNDQSSLEIEKIGAEFYT